MKRKDWPIKGSLPAVSVFSAKNMEAIVLVAQKARMRKFHTSNPRRDTMSMYTVTVICSPEQADELMQDWQSAPAEA